MIPESTTEHVEEGRALLIEQFKNRAVIEGLLATYLRSVQGFENAAWELIDARLLDTAADKHLDRLGDLVGEPRLGRSDDDYRAAIRIRIKVNRSNGRITDILAIAIAATGGGTPRVTEYRYLSFEVEAYGHTGERYTAALLDKARMAGSFGIYTTSETEYEGLQVWDDDVAPIPGTETFNDDVDPTALVCAGSYSMPST